ncbi:hypothetical protein BpHYR1_000552 [Brachionus plicatilis]|uniref:Uncharacterized protein n=1 Tax=Brachionus plicatilis TaxID=10195 RepID=A0A3M7PTB9_BRAPC|nr:hypothetical protein BpHYR1_000552 [Brachionus plicatilis]
MLDHAPNILLMVFKHASLNKGIRETDGQKSTENDKSVHDVEQVQTEPNWQSVESIDKLSIEWVQEQEKDEDLLWIKDLIEHHGDKKPKILIFEN